MVLCKLLLNECVESKALTRSTQDKETKAWLSAAGLQAHPCCLSYPRLRVLTRGMGTAQLPCALMGPHQEGCGHLCERFPAVAPFPWTLGTACALQRLGWLLSCSHVVSLGLNSAGSGPIGVLLVRSQGALWRGVCRQIQGSCPRLQL